MCVYTFAKELNKSVFLLYMSSVDQLVRNTIFTDSSGPTGAHNYLGLLT